MLRVSMLTGQTQRLRWRTRRRRRGRERRSCCCCRCAWWRTRWRPGKTRRRAVISGSAPACSVPCGSLARSESSGLSGRSGTGTGCGASVRTASGCVAVRRRIVRRVRRQWGVRLLPARPRGRPKSSTMTGSCCPWGKWRNRGAWASGCRRRRPGCICRWRRGWIRREMV